MLDEDRRDEPPRWINNQEKKDSPMSSPEPPKNAVNSIWPK